jgi:maltose O-acetyltransferase
MKKIIKRLLYRIRANYITEDLVKMGLIVGKNFHRMHDVILDPSHCWLIEIGDDVTLAPRVHVLAHDTSTKMHLGYTKIGRVKIGNRVFIGADTVLLPNVTIGDNCVIGANSTVSKDIPAGSVAAGNPAKIITSLESFLEKNKSLMNGNNTFSKEYTLRENIDIQKKEIMKAILKNSPGFVE